MSRNRQDSRRLDRGIQRSPRRSVVLNPNRTRLDFCYQFNNDPTSTKAINVIDTNTFEGFTTDVDTRQRRHRHLRRPGHRRYVPKQCPRPN
jgi:hypothetical protein